MLSKLHDWFDKHLTQSDVPTEHTVELATAALLYEVMRADHQFDVQEQAVYRQQLERHFSLEMAELNVLCELTSKHVDEAVDFHQFTRLINDHCDPQQKRRIMDSLWLVAFADHDLSADEEYTIRKIADLLYIPHSQFIKSKLAAQNPSKS
ncbi:MAG: putative tellurite resistance protein B-like protein [Paraglaciecola sp.]|jgi:uncharacterized tellurite resistance protein B-like protein